MLGKTAAEPMTDEGISKAIDLLVSEASKRELEASRFRKASLAKSSKRDPRRPSCRRHCSDSPRAPLPSSELPPKKIREILTLMAPGRPDWVAACRTYKGGIAKGAYLEVASDSAGKGSRRLCAEKLGTPTRDMVPSASGDRIAKGPKLTHGGALSHNPPVKGLGLEDDWRKFVPGGKEYEAKMKLMSNCCSYLRHAFESHAGIKFSKMEPYANFFMHRWPHVRKHGLKATIEYLFARVCGTEKSGLSESLF